jgi:MSHA pilin protein MshD
MRRPAREHGMTLIEVIVSIVVVAIAVTAVLGVLAANVRHSADAMVVTQAVSIAEAYIEEISLKPFADPDGSDGETARANLDDADDYDGLVDAGAVDQFGNAIAGLENYTVSVAVGPSSALPGVTASDTLRIDVRVQFAPYVNYTLSTYRARL